MKSKMYQKQYKDQDLEKLLSCCPTNRENFAFLVTFMRRGVIVPFLGAGVSANFGYPGWENFIRRQARDLKLTEAEEALDKKEYERAAGILKEHLNANGWEYLLLQTFGDHVYKRMDDCEAVELIPKIFRNLILTTNFDEVVELLYAKVNGEYIEKITPKSLNDSRIIYKRIACGEPTLVKLHGDVATREFVLTEEEYDEAYGSDGSSTDLPLPAFLKDILLTRITLFLGCSLESDRTLRVVKRAQAEGGMSFAFLPLPPETENKDDPWQPRLYDEVNGKSIEKPEFTVRKQTLGEYNIIPIWYPYEKKEAFQLFLKAFGSQVNDRIKYSVTMAHDEVKNLMSRAKELAEKEAISQAFYCYVDIEEIINNNLNAFTIDNQIDILTEIKRFYDSNGYSYDRRETVKRLLDLHHQLGYNRVKELAIYYQNIGYTYERYHYYKLMLQAMKKSTETLDDYINYMKSNSAYDVKCRYSVANEAAFIYISNGYAYLKNKNYNNAEIWYQKGEKLLKYPEGILKPFQKAFIYNGLHRYYVMKGNHEKAIEYLDKAFILRNSDIDDYINPQHKINTYSNKIRVYLDTNRLQEAEQECDLCMNDEKLWASLKPFPDARIRILTDQGDVQWALGEYEAAFLSYEKALKEKKYMHFSDDISAADLYKKMAGSLEHIEGRLEEALEYLVQSYMITEKMSGEESEEAKKTKEHLMRLWEGTGQDQSILKRRLDAQRNFMEFRYDDRMDKRQEELIQYFNLEGI